MTHTPGPLTHYEWYSAHTGNHQGLIVEESTGRSVAVTYDKNDAPKIVHCVNVHDELLEALKLAHEWLRNLSNSIAVETMIDTQPYKDKAGLEHFRRVIAKAEGTDHPQLPTVKRDPNELPWSN